MLRAGYVARIQGPACIEKHAVTIQNRCRWLRGVESLELQEVALTTGPACETAVTKTSLGMNVSYFVVVYYCRTYEKAVSGGGEREKGGHVLRDTTSRGLCVRVWPEGGDVRGDHSHTCA